MRIKRLKLTNFRNYESVGFDLGRTVVLLGANGTGKTNLLEAVNLLITGNSFRAKKIEEMVRWEEEVAHISGLISNQTRKLKIIGSVGADDSGGGVELGVRLTRGVVQGRSVAKRKYVVNGVGRRKDKFVGNMYGVCFRPQDLRLIEGSPGRRRSFFNEVLVQVDREYARSIVSYEKGLRRRNKLLDLIRDGKVPENALIFWNQLLIKEGGVILEKRREFVEFVNQGEVLGKMRKLVYNFSAVTESRLAKYKGKEMILGYTMVGPHKDDFHITLQKSRLSEPRNLATYGSRGEQRMGVLWLRLSEMAYIEKSTGERPILMLDDIFSELDDEHDLRVLELMERQQTILSTTELDDKLKSKGMQVVKLEN